MNAVLHLSLTSDRKGNGKRAKMGKLIYMDHAATTAVRPEVLDAMLPYFTEKFGNPSGVYTFASRNKDVINVARDIIADSLGAKPEEARSILPNSLKTEIVCTMNLREWRHFFRLRTAERAHPQIREISVALLDELKKRIPVIFDDINTSDGTY